MYINTYIGTYVYTYIAIYNFDKDGRENYTYHPSSGEFRFFSLE